MVVALVVALLAGCGPQTRSTEMYGTNYLIDQPELEDGSLAYRSSYGGGFDGVWAPAGRTWAVAGMTGFTCQVAFTNGTIGADLDLYGGSEHVFDGRDDVVPSVLVGQGGTLSEFEFPWSTLVDQWEVPGAVDARITDDGIVALVEQGSRCTVEYHAGWDVQEVQVAPAACEDAAFDVDRTTDHAYVAAGDVIAVSPEGAVTIATDADLLAWDALAGQLYLARAGGTELRAVDAGGTVRWAVDLGEPIRGLDDLGFHHGVLVSVERGEGSALVQLDADSGERVDDQGTSLRAGRVRASVDGGTIVLSTAGNASFFSMGEGAGGL